MKEVIKYIKDNLGEILILSSIVLALFSVPGWGWFLFIGLLMQ